MSRRVIAILIIIYLSFFNGQGQISLDVSHMPVVGESYPTIKDTMPAGITIGNAGANQTWDFTNVNNNVTGTTHAVDPSTTPYAGQFAGANIALTGDFATYIFFNKSASSLKIVGLANYDPTLGTNAVAPNPAFDQYRFSIDYQDSFSGSYNWTVTKNYDDIPAVIQQQIDDLLPIGVSVDSIRVRYSGSFTDNIDAWGQVTTPLGTYNCLRRKREENATISIDALLVTLFGANWSNNVAGFPANTLTYEWLTETTKIPVISLPIDTSGNITSATYANIPPPVTEIKVSIKANLGGPYNADSLLMDDNLRTAGNVSLTEPYSGIYTHYGPGGGETIDPAVLSVTGNDAIVDWVFVELRDKSNNTSVIATRSALLQRDGDVVDVDGTSSLAFNAMSDDDYYVVVRHRNHLGVMTASIIALTNTPATVDFTNPATATYGTNAQQEVGSKNVMWSGEVMADGIVKYSGAGNDRDAILTKIGGLVPTNTVPGYHVEDVNMDGIVKYSGINNDRDIILQNIGGIVPTATIQEQLP